MRFLAYRKVKYDFKTKFTIRNKCLQTKKKKINIVN